MKIKLLIESEYNQYERFLCSDITNLFYTSVKYKLFLEALLECQSEYWLAIDEGEIRGVLPLMFRDGKWGRVYNSLPFYGSNGGIIYSCPDSFEVLANYYRLLLQSDNIAASNLVTNPLQSTDYNKIKHNLTDERIGQFTLLQYSDNHAERLMESFHHKTRNMIRKAQKSIDKVIIDNNAVHFIEDVHNQNMIAIGGKPKSKSFFKLFPEYFNPGKDYNIYVALIGDKPVAAMLLFYYNKTVEYFTPVILSEFRNLQPLSALIYQAMIDAAQNNFINWNWGGTWKTQEGVYRFKSRWNTKDVTYTYYNQINNLEIFNATPAELLKEYPDFFVVPFSSLKSQ